MPRVSQSSCHHEDKNFLGISSPDFVGVPAHSSGSAQFFTLIKLCQNLAWPFFYGKKCFSTVIRKKSSGKTKIMARPVVGIIHQDLYLTAGLCTYFLLSYLNFLNKLDGWTPWAQPLSCHIWLSKPFSMFISAWLAPTWALRVLQTTFVRRHQVGLRVPSGSELPPGTIDLVHLLFRFWNFKLQ